MAGTEKPTNTAPTFAVRAQYVKDLSFENPHAPQSLFSSDQRPAIDVAVDLKAQKLQEDTYEVGMHLSVRASTEQNTLFLIELVYGGIFQISGIPVEHLERVLLVECPFVMFPFVRRVVADVSRDGGFPPLLLEPIDFAHLYMQNMQREVK